jgi:predicted transcriptional regulator
MSEVKTAVIELVRQLPDTVTLDEIMGELYFKMQVDAGLQELDQGQGIPHEQVEKRLSKWLGE